MSASTTAEDIKSTAENTESDKKPHVAPPESSHQIWTRRAILLAFWSVVVFLGLPHWLWTTSVYRADLPVSRMTAWSEGDVSIFFRPCSHLTFRQTCKLHFPIHILLTSSDLKASSQWREGLENALNEQSSAQGTPYSFKIVLQAETSGPVDLIVNLKDKSKTPSQATLQAFGKTLDVACATDAILDSCLATAVDGVLDIFRDEQASLIHQFRESPFDKSLSSSSQEISRTADLERHQAIAFKYASSYHLTFSLFAATASPSSWSIEQALQESLNPLIDTFSTISNFTIDTQVQLYSSLSSSIDGPHFDSNTKAWTLSHADLSGFINAAEWPLSPSIDAGPTINFVLYIPSPDQTPMVVADSSSNSWIIPQWGGVKILNRAQHNDHLSVADLEDVMLTFADQLASLIGVPTRPSTLQLRIQSLTRERATSLILSASSTLGALVRLTRKLEQIAIPKSVAHSVSSTLHHLDEACKAVQQGQYQTALEHARTAEDAVEKAFFEPSMVGQVYFPDEHKVAVYVPLLGPMAVPLLMATIKEIKQFRQNKVKTS